MRTTYQPPARRDSWKLRNRLHIALNIAGSLGLSAIVAAPAYFAILSA